MNMGVTETIILVASVLSAITVISIFSSKIFKVFRKFVRFLDDFNGVEERPGVDRHPGFPERIKSLEDCITSMSTKMDKFDATADTIENKLISIEKELHPNHGTSMRDAIDKIQLRLEIVEDKIRGEGVRSTN